jgi:glycosyltransferase involved in cell wall biosynthesis
MLVSAIMPTADRGHLAPVAIRCFLEQTYTESELVIVDNGRVPLVVPEHPRIRYLRHWTATKLNTGQMRNLACENANGEVIVHWDDDDWSAAGRIEYQLKTLLDSRKKVTGFHDILYYAVPTDKTYHFVCHQRPYASGTSQMYYKRWWLGHKFENRPVGEDSYFSAQANRERQLHSVDGNKMIVARAHSANTFVPPLGKGNFLPCERRTLPDEFYQAIKETT